MTNYIPVDKLIAEIERFSATEYGDNTLGDDVANGALNYVLEEIIPSLQQELSEVDLEKEINTEISKWTCYEEIGFGAKYDAKPFDGRDIEKIARYFAEWGAIHLNAKKEEEL